MTTPEPVAVPMSAYTVHLAPEVAEAARQLAALHRISLKTLIDQTAEEGIRARAAAVAKDPSGVLAGLAALGKPR
jgi:hypothetical protein